MTDSRSRQELVAEALRLLDLANAMPVEPAPSEPYGYPPEAIEVLRGLRPTRPGDRVALPVSALTDEEAALLEASSPPPGGYLMADIPDEPDARRVASRAREDALDAMPRDPKAPASRSTATDEAAIEREAVAATRYLVEEGPGGGRVVEVTVRVMVGTARSTVVVRCGREEPVVLHEVRAHGHEAEGLGEVVEAALRAAIEKS